MPVEISDSTLRNLKARLHESMIFKESGNFVPFAIVQRILSRDAFPYLFNFTGFHRDIIESGTKVLMEKYLRVTAILIIIKDGENLARLLHLALTPQEYHSVDMPMDSDLPITRERSLYCFGDEGYDFEDQQHLFTALILTENSKHTINRQQPVRLPFKLKSQVGESGGSGDVYSVSIARGHWINAEKTPNVTDDRLLAQKEFKLRGSSDVQRHKKSFEAELQILQSLRKARTSHVHINYHLASLSIEKEDGHEYSLFYRLAKTDLNRLLWDHEPCPADWNLTRRAETLENATSILDGLSWLHNVRPGCAVWHFDISPRNILVFIEDGKEIWKLSDFDLSIMREKPDWTPTSGDTSALQSPRITSVTSTLPPGSYRAPEVYPTGRVGQEIDVWSFACIHALVLSFLYGGAAGVNRFMWERRGTGSHDFFYRPRPGVPGVSDGVNEGVVRWFNTLCDEAEDGPYKAYVTYVTSRLLKYVFEERDKTKRISAKQLHRKLARELHFYVKACSPSRPMTSNATLQSAIEDVQNTAIQTAGNSIVVWNESSTSNSWHTAQISQPISSGPLNSPTNSTRRTYHVQIESPETPPLTPQTTQGDEPTVAVPPASPPSQQTGFDAASSSSSLPRTIPIRDRSLQHSAHGRHDQSSPHPPSTPEIPEPPPVLNYCSNFCIEPDEQTLTQLLSDPSRNLNVNCGSCGDLYIYQAAKAGPDILRLFLKHRGVDKNVLNDEGRTPVIQCCHEGWEQSAILLAKSGSKFDKKELRKIKNVPHSMYKALMKV